MQSEVMMEIKKDTNNKQGKSTTTVNNNDIGETKRYKNENQQKYKNKNDETKDEDTTYDNFTNCHITYSDNKRVMASDLNKTLQCLAIDIGKNARSKYTKQLIEKEECLKHKITKEKPNPTAYTYNGTIDLTKKHKYYKYIQKEHQEK